MFNYTFIPLIVTYKLLLRTEVVLIRIIRIILDIGNVAAYA